MPSGRDESRRELCYRNYQAAPLPPQPRRLRLPSTRRPDRTPGPSLSEELRSYWRTVSTAIGVHLGEKACGTDRQG